ncbi:MAG: triose-phosphate isomerase [Methanobrevibacter sp.]|uniref:triose-phosphate isomerase n=1 Tax=Methanobrevibacter sp. TaxID=66852 RepID=UPI00257FC3DC|nr:triose-phosphate isomerase [Methanobrevibacter sp.]MBR2665683.1 triose-phosphate isomerase [Methanobrevibacter sp.]MBR7051008.1 triose-phosphate isomerase [Methanobrevibacter sp.]
MDTPIVILNYKTYLESSGANALKLAHDLESAASESGITMVAAPQAADIYRISDEASIPIFAQHIDPISPGGHTGSSLINTLIEAGISGSLINHSENRMKLADIDEVIKLCRDNEIESCVCTNNIETSKAVAALAPDAVAVEPPELIGTGIPVSQAQPEVVEDTVKEVKVINKNIKVLCGAGITTGDDMKAAMDLGADGVLLASGIIKAESPKEALLDLVSKL